MASSIFLAKFVLELCITLASVATLSYLGNLMLNLELLDGRVILGLGVFLRTEFTLDNSLSLVFTVKFIFSFHHRFIVKSGTV